MAKKLTVEKAGALHGVLLIALFSCAAFYIADFPFFQKISFSPLIIGIILGMIYANSLRNHLPEVWVPGIKFSSKQLLRLGIILYGFRLTLQSIVEVGWRPIVIDAVIVVVTIFLGLAVGRYLLKMDRDTTLLTAIGSSICGAAAVLGADAALKPKPYKTAVAVTTVVIFGTLSMFLYPVIYRTGVLGLEPSAMAVYTGATLHEVAHVVGAGNAMGGEIESVAIIVKMIRVIMLVPVLLVLAFCVMPMQDEDVAAGGSVSASPLPSKRKITVPWFAFGFLLVICLNSLLGMVSDMPGAGAAVAEGINACVGFINRLDTFLLTMAMTALGAETSFDKFKKAGPKPFLLAFIIYIWLLGGGYLLVRYML